MEMKYGNYSYNNKTVGRRHTALSGSLVCYVVPLSLIILQSFCQLNAQQDGTEEASTKIAVYPDK